jgi:hypothetical protein
MITISSGAGRPEQLQAENSGETLLARLGLCSIGQLVLGERSEEACGGPAFLVLLRGNRRPYRLDGWQAQLGQHQFEPCRVDGDGAAHGVTCRAAAGRMVASSS